MPYVAKATLRKDDAYVVTSLTQRVSLFNRTGTGSYIVRGNNTDVFAISSFHKILMPALDNLPQRTMPCLNFLARPTLSPQRIKNAACLPANLPLIYRRKIRRILPYEYP